MELLDYEIKHLNDLRPYLSECTVLLKKDGSFPLSSATKIALYGNGARKTVKGGTGSGEVNSRFFVNVEDGLKECGFEVSTKEWIDGYDDVYAKARKKFFDDIKAYAKENHLNSVVAGMGAVMNEPEYSLALNGEGDVAIYVLSRNSGEGSDRKYIKGDILLTDTEIRDILELNNKYSKFMLVLNVGGPVDLTPVNDVKNILILSQLGVETGLALGRILLGEQVPSGKLTTTWATQDTYSNVGEFGDLHDTRYKEGIYVGYRYFDSNNIKPLYPFGFGLSYTDFSLESKNISVDGSKVKVEVEVKNIGSYIGKEVVQIYVSKPNNKQNHAKQDLVAFKKTKQLNPNESELLKIEFDIEELLSYDEETCSYYLEEGNYLIRVGNSSVDNKVEKIIHLNKEVIIKQVRSAINKPDFKDFIPNVNNDENIDGIEIINVDTSIFEKEVVDYDTNIEVADVVKKMSDDELLTYNVGGFDPKGGIASIIGSSSTLVAGAAGESSSFYKNPNMPIMVVADGPAGLRISKDCAKDEKGVHTIGVAMPESMAELLAPWMVKLIGALSPKPKKNATYYHQYCTAIPIGTAIAQSFNEDFAQICGDVVASEMEIFNVHVWLAPALNIHRDIRCGRNFEYYSEDPLISGKMAAAVTKGVQKHDGCGVSIKHYCANNQELNRANNNSIMSERALREIYLKGFEICIKDAKPLTVMTSYNLLNGTHVSESKSLVSDVLFKEFGHVGLAMTDWTINHGTLDKRAIHPGAYADRVAAAGVSMFMPGSKGDIKDIQKGFKNNTITREQLEINITRLYKVINYVNKKGDLK